MKIAKIFFMISYITLGISALGTTIAVLLEPFFGARIMLIGISTCSISTCFGAYLEGGKTK